MLPACRTEGDGVAIPSFEMLPSDVEGFMDELRTFQSAFHDCFSRSEPREHFFDYMVGQVSPLERKSIEPMALKVAGGNIRGLQRLISDVAWDEDQMRWTYHHLVADAMGAGDGVLIFDETGFVKKGTDSAGVARQYCGPLGKVENCQVGVFAGYATRHGYALVEQRLFLPEVWFRDAYGARRQKCRVPDELTFQSKPQLAAEMLKAIVAEGLLLPARRRASCWGKSSTGRRKVPTLPSPPALDTAAASSAEVKAPMPAWMMGNSMPNRVHNGVWGMMLLPERGFRAVSSVPFSAPAGRHDGLYMPEATHSQHPRILTSRKLPF